MESEPALKKFKTYSDPADNVNEFESNNTGHSAELESEETVKLNVKDTSLQNETNLNIVEPLEDSVFLEEVELNCASPQRKKSNSVDNEYNCSIITNEDQLTFLNDLPFEEDEANQFNTSFNKDKSNTIPPKKLTNSSLKGKKKKRKYIENTVDVVPNYFVSVQVSNPEIHKAVLNVQKTMLSSNEKLSGALIDVATLHITLFVLHISTEDQLHLACSALDHCMAKLSKNLSEDPICLKFSGVSHFSNKVIFAQLVEDNDYKRFLEAAELIQKIFVEMGIILTDDRNFTPHLTIAKLSKLPKTKENIHIRKIQPEVYASETNRYFGEQYVSGLQLLSMVKRKTEKRYYYSERESLFDFVPKESSDHSECCFLNQPNTPKGSGFKKETSSSTPDSSNISSSSVFFRWFHRPNLKETLGDIRNLKDISCEDKRENNRYYDGQFCKPHTYICGQFLGEVYAFLFVEFFHHILDSFIN